MQDAKLETSIARYLLGPESGLSLELQGLVWRLRFLMRTSERLGYLQINGEKYPPAMLASKVGTSAEHLLPLLEELAKHKVFPETREGVWYDPAMVGKARERIANAERQRAFRDRQAALHNADGNGAITETVTRDSNARLSPSSSLEGKGSQEEKKKEKGTPLRNGESNAALRNAFLSKLEPTIPEPDWGVGKAVRRAERNVDGLLTKLGVERCVALFEEAHERMPTASLPKLANLVLDILKARNGKRPSGSIPTKEEYAELERKGF